SKSAESLSAYHFDSQSLIIPTLRPIGFILFPTDYPSFFSVTTTVTCLVRLFLLLALPCARGRNRLSVAPSPTYTSDTIKFSGTSSCLCSAFAVAEFNTFY